MAMDYRMGLKLVAFAAPAMLASPAAQADEFYFKTPSGNIFCGYDNFGGQAYVRCDIKSYMPASKRRPADCDLDWGDSFAIAAKDKRGTILCHGDTIINPEAQALPYGAVWKRGGIACASETTGLTCTNRRGHGFFLSKAEQRVF